MRRAADRGPDGRAVVCRIACAYAGVLARPGVLALALAVVVVACAPRVAGTPVADDAIAGAAATVRADLARPATLEPAPTARPVTADAAALILPADLLQQPSVTTSTDEPWGAFGRHRVYATADYYYIDVKVLVYRPGTSGTTGIAGRLCRLTWGATGPNTTGEVKAEVIGDDAKACLYHWEGRIADWVQYIAATRNVLVEVSLEPRTIMSTEAALARAVDYARRQLDVISALAPP